MYQQVYQYANEPLPDVDYTPNPYAEQEPYEEIEAYEEYEYEPRPAGRAAAKAAKPGSRKRRKRVIIAILLLFVLLAGLAAAGLGYLDGIFETGLLGSLVNKNYVPKNYSKKDVVNFLIVGIDNEEGRDYGAGLGMTDMILYANFDIKNNRLNLMQIPRDSYVGEENTGGTGKINALVLNGPDKSSPINNLADVVEQQFKLPVDHYVALDMDALKEIVNVFGGIKVYIPREMSFAGSYLPQGWHWLDGDSAEFFVRNRSGEGFERADIDRLDNQRHFYSALFRRFLNLSPGDIVKLLPVVDSYCNTDIPLRDIFDLAFSALNLNAESVLFCKAPGTTGAELDPAGIGRDMYLIDVYGRGTPEEPGVAELMNQYFRTYSDPVPAADLGLPQVDIPPGYPLYSPNVQVMTEVQAPEGGAEVDVET